MLHLIHINSLYDFDFMVLYFYEDIYLAKTLYTCSNNKRKINFEQKSSLLTSKIA